MLIVKEFEIKKNISTMCTPTSVYKEAMRVHIREDLNRKKRFLSGIARIRGWGGSTHARIFWPPFFAK